MTSKSLQAKIARMQAAAPYELTKARLCAHVVLASALPEEGTKDDV